MMNHMILFDATRRCDTKITANEMRVGRKLIDTLFYFFWLCSKDQSRCYCTCTGSNRQKPSFTVSTVHFSLQSSLKHLVWIFGRPLIPPFPNLQSGKLFSKFSDCLLISAVWKFGNHSFWLHPILLRTMQQVVYGDSFAKY